MSRRLTGSRWLTGATCSLLLVTAACKGGEPPPKPVPATGSGSGSGAGSGSAATAALPPTPEPPPIAGLDTTTLFGRLKAQAANRPTGTITAESIMDALRGVGVEVTDVSQCLGKDPGAGYCAAGITKEGVIVSVTEFASPAEAEAGRALSQARFKDTIPGRRQLVRGATLLTLVGPDHGPLLDKAEAAFTALPIPPP